MQQETRSSQIAYQVQFDCLLFMPGYDTGLLVFAIKPPTASSMPVA
jgi:hypothetical protein